MRSSCDICGNEIEVQLCCNGYECGCMGIPVEPPVCSNNCYDKFMENINKVKITPVKLTLSNK